MRLEAAHGHHVPVFNLLRYLTFRTGAALFTGQAVVGAAGPALHRLAAAAARAAASRSGSDGHRRRHVLEKAGTPTMGGFMILAGVIVGGGADLWCDLASPFVWIVLMVTFGLRRASASWTTTPR